MLMALEMVNCCQIAQGDMPLSAGIEQYVDGIVITAVLSLV